MRLNRAIARIMAFRFYKSYTLNNKKYEIAETKIIRPQITHNIWNPRAEIVIEAIIGATTPLLCQKKFAKPDMLPAFLLSISDTALEFAGVIMNLTKPIIVAINIICTDITKYARAIVSAP